MSTHEHEARVVKARRLAEILSAAGVEAGDEITETTWHLAISVLTAQRRKPVSVPSTATRILVAHMLAHAASVRAEPADPFAGLPS